jgi:hypothetical protein
MADHNLRMRKKLILKLAIAIHAKGSYTTKSQLLNAVTCASSSVLALFDLRNPVLQHLSYIINLTQT